METGLFTLKHLTNNITELNTKNSSLLTSLGDVLYIDTIKGVGIQRKSDLNSDPFSKDYPKDRDTVANLIYQSVKELA